MFKEEDLKPELWYQFIKSISKHPDTFEDYSEIKSPELDQRLLSFARIAFATKNKEFMKFLEGKS